MHSPIAPVFASLARGDSYRVDPWIVALCSGRVAVASDDGDEAAAVEAIHHCRVLIAFVSSTAAEGGPVATDIAQCQAANTPVIIVLLDDTDVSECSDRATVIDIRRTGRRESWDLLIKDLARHGVRWRDPEVRRFWQKRVINERSSAVRARRWAYIAGFIWIALVLGYVFFLRPAEKEAPKAIAVPTPTLSVETPPRPPATTPAPVNPSPQSSSAPLTPPPQPPTSTTPPVPTPTPAPAPTPATEPLSAQDTAAIEHVRACIAASNRVQALSDDQIESIVRAYFSNPARIQDTGPRDFEGIKANLALKQTYWPSWNESVDSATIVERSPPNSVVVLIKSHGQGANAIVGSAANMQLATRYTVSFTLEGRPLISAVFGEPVRQQ